MANVFQRLFGGRRPPVHGEAPAAGAVTSAEVVAHARSARDLGHFGPALLALDDALQRQPDDPALLEERGTLLFAWRRYDEARRNLVRALEGGRRSADVLLHLGWIDFRQRGSQAAETWMREAATVAPGRHDVHANLGFVLRARGRVQDALASYRRALDLRASDADSLMGEGDCLIATDPVRAEQSYRRALAAGADPSIAHATIGMALSLQDRNAEALEAFERSAALDTGKGAEAVAFSNLAIHVGDEGRTQEALAIFERGLGRYGGVEPHLAYAHALLRAGRWREGWEQYEFRWLVEPGLSRRPAHGRPMWNGQDLAGRTVLLGVEQGIGDTFQFVRYAPWLKALGARVVMMPGAMLSSIAKSFPGVDQWVASEAELPPFDYHVPLLSLPRIFGTEIDTVPAEVPYLRRDEAREAHWSRRLPPPGRLRVGIVWAGNPLHVRDRYRSLSFAALAPLLAVEGVTFVSLQKGLAADAPACAGARVLDLGNHLADWTDTAAALASIDLLVTVDTAVAHLAGALARPVWMLLPQPPDFRWLEERDDTPWYPTMRLFRQPRRNDWAAVIARVAHELEAVRDSLMPAAVDRPVATPRDEVRPRAAVAPDARSSEFATVAHARSGSLVCAGGERDAPTLALHWYGEHLRWQVDLLASLLPQGGHWIEVGAGSGDHALLLARALGPAGHGLVHEQDPVARALLAQNVAANGRGRATVMRRGLGRPGEPMAPGAAPSEPTDGLDDLRLERLDLVKVRDVALALAALAGADDALWRLRPLVFVGDAGAGAAPRLAEHLRDRGYRCWTVRGPLFQRDNFNGRTVDIFDGATCDAMLALPEERDPPPDSVRWTAL